MDPQRRIEPGAKLSLDLVQRGVIAFGDSQVRDHFGKRAAVGFVARKGAHHLLRQVDQRFGRMQGQWISKIAGN